jgi:hypothetical protein
MRLKTLPLFLLSSILYLTTGLSIFANNDCANAIALTPGNSCSALAGSFAGSTMADAPPPCAPSASQDIWFSFVASEKTMGITISAVGGLNHGFEVIEGSCGGTVLGCINDNGSGNAETWLSNSYSVGLTYYIRVFNANTLIVSSSFNICVQQYAQPANNSCQNAQLILASESCQTETGTMRGAGIEGDAPGCFDQAAQDVWYRFDATDSTMSITLESSSGLNHGFELLVENCTGQLVTCVNNGSSGNSEFYLSNQFQIGKTYFVRVFNASSVLSTASFGICIRTYAAPANDQCINAINLVPGASCVNTPTSLSGSGISGNLPACANQASQDIWFKFTADNKIMGVSLSAAGGLNHGFEIYQNNCSGELIACVNNTTSGIGEFYLGTDLNIGEIYFIRVFNVNPAYNTGTFNICIQNYPAPVNDACAGATTLVPALSCVNTPVSFSGSGIENPLPNCGANSSQDIWYQFTATQVKMSVTISAVSGLNHGFEIFTGSCNGNVLTCTNANASGTSETYLNNNFIQGETYYIRVFNANPTFNTSGFNICVQAFAPPSNNTCANARNIAPQGTCINTSASFSGASLNGQAPACAINASQDIWFRFKATDSTMSIGLAATPGLNHGFEIIENSCGGNVLNCINVNSSGAVENFTGKIFVPGQDYFVRAFNVNPVLSLANFNLCIFGVIPPCIASVEISASDTSICEGTAVTFTANPINGGFSPDFQWKINGLNAGANSNIFTSEDLSDGAIITCTMISNDPCANPSEVNSNPISIDVETAIVPDFGLIAPLCEGTIFSLPEISTNGIDGTWTPETNTMQTTTYLFNPDSGLCAAKAELTVVINEKVKPEFDQIESVCKGGTIALNETSLNNISGTWQPEINNTETTTYTFTSDSNQCADDTSMTVSVIVPDTGISIEGNFIVAAAEEASYQWVNCDANFAAIDGKNAKEFEITVNGNFAAIVNYSGCIDTTRCVQISTVSLDYKGDIYPFIFPNPSTDYFILYTGKKLSGERYMIFDSMGKIILSGIITGEQTMIDIHTLSDGFYLIRFAGNQQIVKLLKQ